MTKKKRPIPPPDLTLLDGIPDAYAKNQRLLEWLTDDGHRASLFDLIKRQGGALEFPSRAAEPEPCCPDNEHPRPPPKIGHQTVELITARTTIEAALADGGPRYSSRVYAELGGGNFVLALDPMAGGSKAHSDELQALKHSFPDSSNPDLIPSIAHHACEDAAILSLAGPRFDLAAFAEQAALRFCMDLFGYADSDFPLLEKALRASYRALVYQVLGRHFSSDPLAVPTAKTASAQLLKRTAALTDAYATDDEDGLKGCRRARALNGLMPVLEKLGKNESPLNGEQRALIAVGAAIGTVGNVQAAVCIAVKALFADTAAREQARKLALAETQDRPSKRHGDWGRLIGPALSANPPIAFLPRMKITEVNGTSTYREVLLALGGATEVQQDGCEDPLVWGLPGTGIHACFGKYLARPLIAEVVRHVMGLPDLAEALDPLDASVIGLDKRWGFLCESYPFTHRRDRRVAQFCLNVAMRIKSPIEQNAIRLREVIHSGAPRIHELLRESRHVHFAWFEFIESDTVLVLHTVYDGNFAAYIDHFALQAGDLFDTLFESIEDAPPAPVARHPHEFVALIQRYNRAPAMGYFFSAYPASEVATITRKERACL